MIMKDKAAVRHEMETLLRSAAMKRGRLEAIHIVRAADPVDMTQQAAEREMATLSIDRESTTARRIRAAINRVDDGSYGICVDCEEEIALKRLKAIPWAERCIRCQEDADNSSASQAA